MIKKSKNILFTVILVLVIQLHLRAQKPNVIVIITDDAGYADWGFQGSTVMETPHIDQLKSEGTIFTQAYVTNSVCAPSRAGLMTGRYQNRFGFDYNIVQYHAAPGYTLDDVGMDTTEVTIADYLKDLGYATAAIGKWHLGAKDHHHPNNRGYDYFYGLLDGSRPYFHTSDLPDGKKLMRNFVIDDLTEGYVTDVLTTDVIDWIGQQVDQGIPFFTYLSYTAVHGPYESKTEDFDHFAGNCIGFDGNACSTTRQNYAAMTYSLDNNVSKLIDSLKAKGVYDNTLLFFINDNGGPNPGSVTDNGILRGGKSTYNEGGLRVPFFMVWPGNIPAGNTYNKAVISLDILPTIVKAAGGDITPEMETDGVDLLPVINDTSLEAHDYLYWRKFLVWDVVQKDNYKLVVKHNDPGYLDNDTMLFNLAVDIGETTNIYESPDEEIAADLLQKYSFWEEELANPAWIGDEISNRQCGDDATDMTTCENILIAYGLMEPPLQPSIIWAREGESAIMSGTVEIKAGCEYASGGDFVKMLNVEGNSILFNDIQVVTPKTYEMVIDYFQTAETKLELLVNEVSMGELIFPPANWCYKGPAAKLSVDVEFLAGLNSVELKVIPGVDGPFIDIIRIFNPLYVHVPKTYFVSDADGDNTNDGLSKLTPFKTLEKINQIPLGPADSILFKAGDNFIGKLVVNGSGKTDSAIVISSYGDGDKPVINGAGAVGGDHQSAILINNNDYIEVLNLEITNDREVPREGIDNEKAYGIYVHNDGNEIMNHLVFKHLTIRDIFAIDVEGMEFNAVDVAGIKFRSERNTEAGKEKHIKDVLVDSCYFARTTRYGIHTAHAGGDTGVGNDSLNRNMNLVFRNNHFSHTGGSCITPGRSYNCLVENNIFDSPGSGMDPRMVNRGSAAWFWNCRNIVAQYNKTYHVRGYADSYSMHIDFGNENVIFQYNYSEDSEGGFVEILGNNKNSVYRFNVSVNDGFRDNGKTLWLSDFAGTGNRIKSDENYIYNNSAYINENITPDITIISNNTYVYNNIFYADGLSAIGEEVKFDISDGSTLDISNNLYFGNISNEFTNMDTSPVYGDPGYASPGGLDTESYKLIQGSPAIGAGKTFVEPVFPNAGKGIFKDVKMIPEFDLYGNAVNLANDIPSIGAFNADPVSGISFFKNSDPESNLSIYPNPVKESLNITFTA
ncbi:MAG: sulfatase-like hydrolase/transferase, partial [Bacteroidales bacterium]|nr:sulfatase-like hydrolase/transferase [Bacteroidales bacterium]